MIKVIQMEESDTDNVTKYILEDPIFGKNEVSVIRKDTKNIIVLPSQTNCKMGCKFCHLTGTTRPVENLSIPWFVNTVKFIMSEENFSDKPLLISFMGAGEPMINYSSIALVICHWNNTIPNIKFALATMYPNVRSFNNLTDLMKVNSEVSLKIHLSVHGTFNRDKLITSSVSIYDAIDALRNYNEVTNNPIEYHYTLVNGINDSIEELTDFSYYIQSDNAGYRMKEMTTVKFLSLSECGEYKKTLLTEEEIRNIFPGITVEFYDPPGRDVGSSCGMFDRSLYMKD